MLKWLYETFYHTVKVREKTYKAETYVLTLGQMTMLSMFMFIPGPMSLTFMSLPAQLQTEMLKQLGESFYHAVKLREKR